MVSLLKSPFFWALFIFTNGLYANSYAFTFQDTIPESSVARTLKTQADPQLIGPDKLCLLFGFSLGEFEAGGDEVLDRFYWLVTNNATGEEVFNRSGGGTFQNITINFTQTGTFTVALQVTRNGQTIYEDSKVVEVIEGPEIIIRPDYLLCGNAPTTIQAINPATPNLDQFTFEWRDAGGNVVGTQNDLVVTQEGRYAVSLYFTNNQGGQDCLIEGDTFVGPLDDFTINVPSDQVCQGEIISITTDTPVAGDWSYIKDNDGNRVFIANSFNLELDTDNLQGPGDYQLIFTIVNPNNPTCGSERIANLRVDRSPQFTLDIQGTTPDCSVDEGGFTFTAVDGIDLLEIPDLGFTRANVPAGEVINFPGLASGLYLVQATAFGCRRSRVARIEAIDPDLEALMTVSSFPESCSNTGRANGQIRISFLNVPIAGEIRIINAFNGNITSQAIPNESEFSVDVPGGTYTLAIIDANGCIIPWQNDIVVDRQPQVDFSVPTDLVVCENFELIPATDQNLVFTIQDPNGNEVTVNTGDPYLISTTGAYRIIGVDPNNAGLCPRTRTVNVTFSQPIEYDLGIAFEDCFGNIIYQANLMGRNANDVSIRWLNSEGEIVGRAPLWAPTAVGDFTLDVQPRSGGGCEGQPVSFRVDLPVLEVEMLLAGEPLCPESPFTVINLETDLTLVDSIAWIYIDPDGNQSILTEFTNETDIVGENEGTYEVVGFNSKGCEIGRDLIMILRLETDQRPSVETSYTVCSDINFSQEIYAGPFESYEWYFNGNVVSTDSVYRPTVAGNYSVVVGTDIGCTVSGNFTVFEECEFQYVMPTGMILSDPNRLYEVFLSDAVEEVRIWIYNRQGELVYYCENFDVVARQPFCQWDGRINGQKVPVGTYSVTLGYRSEQFGVNEKIFSNLVILE